MSHLVYQADQLDVNITVSYGILDTPDNIAIREALSPLIPTSWVSTLQSLYAEERAIITRRQKFIAQCRTTFDLKADATILQVKTQFPELFI